MHNLWLIVDYCEHLEFLDGVIVRSIMSWSPPVSIELVRVM